MWPHPSLCLLAFLLSISLSGACPPIVGNCYVFQPTDEWNRPIDTDPVDYQSSCIIHGTLNDKFLRLDGGTTGTDGYGMTYNVYNTTVCKTPMKYGTDGTSYQDESEWYSAASPATLVVADGSGHYAPAVFPFPKDALIEGQTPSKPNPTSGDRHVVVLDGTKCMLYESWNTVRSGEGFMASNTAVWDLTKDNKQRKAGWTSADAAGLAIYPGMLKYHEIAAAKASGASNLGHALRFTAQRAQMAYAKPGRHEGPQKNATYPWYGARYRLKASYDVSPYSRDTQILLNTLKTYGMIFADQGSGPWLSLDMSNPNFSTLFSEINSGTKRVPFNDQTWEVVQPPEAITRGWSAGTVTCNGRSANANPGWVPNWKPTCPTPPVIHPITKCPGE